MKNTMNHIIYQTSLEGKLLRPLSAKILAPTDAEKEGIVDRNLLLDINGRGRDRQMALAASFGITDYAAPAGGCLFTDPHIARRIKDLYDHNPAFTLMDIFLLSIGRHFRLNEHAKFIVPRREEETRTLEKYKNEADLYMYSNFPGPSVFVCGTADENDISLLASLIARYGKPEKEPTMGIVIKRKNADEYIIPCPPPADESRIESMRL